MIALDILIDHVKVSKSVKSRSTATRNRYKSRVPTLALDAEGSIKVGTERDTVDLTLPDHFSLARIAEAMRSPRPACGDDELNRLMHVKCLKSRGTLIILAHTLRITWPTPANILGTRSKPRTQMLNLYANPQHQPEVHRHRPGWTEERK